jgi:hypothetical protein
MKLLWTEPGLPAAPAYGHDQARPIAVPDGAGGVFLVWTQFASYDGSKGWVGGDIRAQRLNAEGQPLWAVQGVAVCADPGEQIHPAVAPDGSGGVVIAWEDLRNGASDVYAQRLSADGTAMWAANGVPVTRAPSDQQNPEICGDGKGGAFVTWEDYRAGKLNEDIYARKIGADGVVAGTADTAIAAGGATEFWPRIAADAAGGALVGYTTKTKVMVGPNTTYVVDIKAAHLAPSGATDGAATVCDAANDQILNDVQPDGQGGFLLAWWDYRAGVGNGDIYAQRLNATLAPQWEANGHAVDTRATDEYLPTILPSTQGILIFYHETGQLDDLRAARLALDGAVAWSSAALSTDPDKQVYPVGASDGAGGAYVAWEDYRNNQDGAQPDVYVQHLTGAGQGAWADGGVPLAATASYEDEPTIATDGAGGAIVAWEDWTDISGGQVMVERMTDLTAPDTTSPTADITAPADGALCYGGSIEVSGTADDAHFATATLAWGAGASPAAFTDIATLTAPVTDGLLATWNTFALGTGVYTLRLTASDTTGNTTTISRTVSVVKTGDLDGDGAVSLADVRAGLRIAAGLQDAAPFVVAAGDVEPAVSTAPSGHGDGTLDITDAARLARAAAGLDTLP